MWAAKLGYLAVTLVALLFSILYLPVFSVYLLVLLLAMPVCLFALSWWSRAHLQVTLETIPGTIPPNTPFYCTVHLCNRSRLPIGAVAVTLGATHSITGESIRTRQKLSLPGRNTVQLFFSVAPEHCGQVTFQVVSIRLYDWLRMFSRTRRVRTRCIAGILPSPPVLSVAEVAKEPDTGEVTYLPTTEPEEFSGVRDYRQGDRMRDIHWKLSSKQETPVVRTYGAPVELPVTLLLHYALDRPVSAPAALTDLLFQSAVLLTAGLCGAKQKVRLVVDGGQDGAAEFLLETPAQIIPVLYDLAQGPPQVIDPDTNLRTLEEIDAAYCIVPHEDQIQLWAKAADHTRQVLSLVPDQVEQTICTLLGISAPEGGAP